MNFWKILFCVLLLLIPGGTAIGATITIPGDYPTIQAGIDAALPGDTVLVRPGTYHENLIFNGRWITVRSKAGPEETFIKGAKQQSVVYFAAGETPNTVLEGFTISNGEGTLHGGITPRTHGGGIFCNGASPTITNNIIAYNRAEIAGGICCIDSDAVITKNTITHNYGSFDVGGIHCAGAGSTPLIAGNIIMDNEAFFGGGGVDCIECAPTIDDNFIAHNHASTHDGGGISCHIGSSPSITNNFVYENTARGPLGDGGGVLCDLTVTATIAGNIIMGNSCRGNGGGIWISTTDVTIVNNTITGNRAAMGGGIFSWNTLGSTAICNCTLVKNVADAGGGAAFEGADATIANTIFWGNSAAYGASFAQRNESPNTSEVTISHSVVQNGKSSVHVESGAVLHWGAGIMQLDPLFVELRADDFHLSHFSPCLNAGSNNAVPPDADTDLEGDPRIWGGKVDIGADEFYTHLYMIGDVTPGGTVSLRVIGAPHTNPVALLVGDGFLETPVPTMHGNFLLMPPWWGWSLGSVPLSGVLNKPITIPPFVPPGTKYYLQALVGPWGGAVTLLSNGMVLRVY